MREDPLMTWLNESRRTFTENSNRILIGGVIVIVALGIAIGINNARRGAEVEAAGQLAQAQFQLWSDNPTQAVELADDILVRWPGTRSARLSQLVRGDAFLASARPREALEAYRAFLAQGKARRPLRIAAMRGEATALEDSGQFSEAAQRYQELAREFDHGTLIAQDLIAAARCLERAGDAGSALALYEEVLNDHPQVQQRPLIELKLRELGGSAGSTD